MEQQKVLDKSLKKFNFFEQQILPDKRQANKDITLPTLTDLEISPGMATILEPKLYFGNKKDSCIYAYNQDQISEKFQAYTDQLIFLVSVIYENTKYLVTFGIDTERDQSSQSSLVKFWEVDSLKLSGQEYNPDEIRPKKSIIIETLGGKKTSLLTKQNQFLPHISFGISSDFQAMAFGELDGTIILYVSKNLLTTNDLKQKPVSEEKTVINKIFFHKDQGNNHIFYSSKQSIACLQNLKQRKLLSQPGSGLCDLSDQGQLFSVNPDSQEIYQFNKMQRVNVFTYEGEKLELKCFGNNYLLVVTTTNQGHQFLNIYDCLNNYIAYQQRFSLIQHVIVSKNLVHIIALNQSGEKQLYRLKEKDNSVKLETFFKCYFFDVALKFAKNQNADPALLAEISRLHGDHLYGKGDYQNAIKHYTSTAGFIEPSDIIRRFLDVTHIEYLISYLEIIHEKKLADKHHTSILLNCYVKQKQINKLENFLKKSDFSSDLFDTETAIKVCRELGYTDLGLRLSKQTQQNEWFLRILIDDNKDYQQAIQYIQLNLKLEDKIKYFREFGQVLMKHQPEKSLEFLMKLVQLQIIKKTRTQSYQQQSSRNNYNNLTQEERDVFQSLNIDIDQDLENLNIITFPKPDEFLHLFVVNNEQLEKYLLFLKSLKNIPNERVIINRLLEYYLEKYAEYYNKNQQAWKYRLTEDIELKQKTQVIMDLLNDPEYERKYDKNQLLVLFKMYKFDQGITFILDKLQLREELLHFYMEKGDNVKVLEICKKFGQNETNLWIQALKFYCKSEDKNKQQFIEDTLEDISKIDLPSQLILSILEKSKNISFGIIKKYFKRKLEEERDSIKKDTLLINQNREQAQQGREQYYKLKTQAKIFQSTKCSQCEMSLTLPSIHFLCGHSFDDNCLVETEKGHKECSKCQYDHKRILDSKESYDNQINKTNVFYEKLNESSNKFDVIAEYFGRGLFKQEY